ncbi:MAG: pseudouridine synthase [Lachnospiraceae bacterium]
MDKNIRINKYLSENGICSRREADRLIEQQLVMVDGVLADTGMRVNAGQEVRVRNKVVHQQNELIMLAVNKPIGIICTEEKKTKNNIINYLNYKSRITYIGRLDKDSEGLLLMTNNGDIINQMMRAANWHEKEYKVTVHRPITSDFIKKMSIGVHIKKIEHNVVILDEITRPCIVEQIGKFKFRIILTQGLNRQIRRMCETLGYKVEKLERVRIMNIELGNLKPGAYRDVTSQELECLYKQLNHTIEYQPGNDISNKTIIGV